MFEKIPQELKAQPHWVAWQTKKDRKGRDTKVPINAQNGAFADSTDPKTWTDFSTAEKLFQDRRGNGIKGIGFVVTGTEITGLDLDRCRDPQTGIIEEWGKSIISVVNSYSEVTPSGCGIRIFAIGKLPEGRRKIGKLGPQGKGALEMYDSGRFLTTTGTHVEGTPLSVQRRQEEISAIHANYFPKKESPPPPSKTSSHFTLEDGDLIEKAKAAKNGGKFGLLWNGDWQAAGFPSQSEADLSLCSLLAFWSCRDPLQMDRLFRSSGLMRDKWDERHGERTYGQITINEVLSGNGEIYSPGNQAQTKRDLGAGNITQAVPQTIEVGPNLTDLGNARRFVLDHGRDLRYCYPWGKWLSWDDRQWRIDDTGEIYRRAKKTIGLMYREAGENPDEKLRKQLGAHALRSESDSKIKAMLSLAQSEPGIPVLPDEMDQNPWVVNVLNGTLDLKTGALGPHRREDVLTKLAPVEYQPEAACPFWLEHLAKIFNGNIGLISFLQLGFGYSLTGITDERNLFISHGSGANGKSTTHEVFAQILGDYAVRTPTETLLVKREGGIPNDLAKLKGARFVFCSEVEEGRRMAESLIKDLTGNDTISARFMRGEWFSFQPSFKLWLATNHKPIIRGTDNAIWSRIRLIPFTVSIPECDRIPRSRMMGRLTPELPGILAWGVQGCLDWVKFGLGSPDEVKQATENYRDEMDIIGGFIDEVCVVGPNERATAKDLYYKYTKWGEENGEKPITQKAFGQRLSERGFHRKRGTGGAWQYLGVGLEAGLPLKSDE